MKQHLASVTLVVNDYDEAIAFYVHKLGFELLEDSLQGVATLSNTEKRWVIVSPPGAAETRLLLAKADGAEQSRVVGNQAGGRVMFILFTD
ncbi:MAG: VOC family protein, partial [Granulosicoccus sp.]